MGILREIGINDQFSNIWCREMVSNIMPLRCLQIQFRYEKGSDLYECCNTCKESKKIQKLRHLFGTCHVCGSPVRFNQTKCDRKCFIADKKGGKIMKEIKKDTLTITTGDIAPIVEIKQENKSSELYTCQNLDCKKEFEAYKLGSGVQTFTKYCPDCLILVRRANSLKANIAKKERGVIKDCNKPLTTFAVTLDFSSFPDLIEKIRTQAIEELRTVEMQILYILKQAL